MNSWRTLPTIPIFSPVMALASDAESLWAGGVGGVACFDGHAWTVPTGQPPVSSVSALCLAGSILLAGGPEGVAYSQDQGQTWEMALQDFDIAPVSAFLAGPGDRCLAATMGGGVLRSEDGGKSWDKAGEGLGNLEVLSLARRADDVLLAGTTNGVYRSTDGGQSWQASAGTDGLIISGVTFLPGETMPALAALEEGRLLISTGSGDTWESFETTGMPAEAEINTLAAGPDGSLLVGTSAGTLRSLDGGQSWGFQMEAGALCLHPWKTATYIGLADGVAVSAGGKLERLPAPPLNDLRALLYARGRLYVTGLQSGLWRLNGQTWQNIASPADYITAVSPTPTGALVLAGVEGLFRSDDDGQSWECVYSGEMRIDRLSFRGGPFPVGPGAAASTDGQAFLVTADDGKTWQPLDLPFEGQPLAALSYSDGTLAAATYSPETAIARLWSSVDNGLTWRRGLEANTNWGIVILTEPPALITLGGTMIIRQPGGGWQPTQVGPEGSGILRAAGDGKIIAALSSAGLLHTADFGKTWQVAPGTPAPGDIFDLLVKDGKILLLLASGQVMQLELS